MRTVTAARRAPLAVRVLIGLTVAVGVGLVLQALRAAPVPGVSAANDLRTAADYLGQAAAPYLLVPFVAGRLARTRVGAVVGGIVTCWILVAAYYGWFIPGSMAFERGGNGERAVWLVAAVFAGATAGLLGRAPIRSGVLRFVMPAALLLEPVGWLVLLALRIAPVLAQPQDVVGAVVEAAVGAVWLILLVRAGEPVVRPGGIPAR